MNFMIFLFFILQPSDNLSFFDIKYLIMRNINQIWNLFIGYGCEYSSLDNTSTTNSFETYDYYKNSAKNNYHTNEARGFSDSTNE